VRGVREGLLDNLARELAAHAETACQGRRDKG
jgi:hypothetical protein